MKYNTKSKNIIPLIFIFFILAISCKTTGQSNTTDNESVVTDKIDEKYNILVFSKTNGWRHKSIPEGITALKKLSKKNDWKIEFTEDSLFFNTKKLSNFNTIIFLNTTGNILDSNGEKNFENFIKQGGGFVGVHSASDTEFDWKFYKEMVGAQFASHPKTQKAKVNVHHKTNHPAIKHYQDSFEKVDEWYNFKEPVASHVNVILELDESSYEGKRMGINHPIAWYHYFEGGRVFYTGMGHTKETYIDVDFITHLEAGILWSLYKTNVNLPEKEIDLLDKKLSKWDVWNGAVHNSVDLGFDFEKTDDVHTGKPLGLNNDVKNVFSVVEENGEQLLKITGEVYGGLTSKEEYANYHFTTEFKWGEKKWEPRLKRKRDSGILYHAKGVHGAFWNTWMSCLEFQVQEGDCGDFIALGEVYGDVPADRKLKEDGKPYFVYNPSGEEIPLKWAKGFESGQASKSTLHENPNGEWNKLEIICIDNESIHIVNGHLVNRVKNARYDVGGKTVPVTRGKIQIQSEAAEVYYKNIKITPISKFPKKYSKK